MLAEWEGDKIKSLQLVELNKGNNKRFLLGVSYTLDELGLYDGKEPNENLKKFYDAFADMLIPGAVTPPRNEPFSSTKS